MVESKWRAELLLEDLRRGGQGGIVVGADLDVEAAPVTLDGAVRFSALNVAGFLGSVRVESVDEFSHVLWHTFSCVSVKSPVELFSAMQDEIVLSLL